ncbi:MAG: DUF5335 family protein [Blastocatellia bacterium]
MPTQEIASYEWLRFFDEFSRLHQGQLVTIEILGLDIGNQVQARDLPLIGITVEPNEVGEDQILIVAGRPEGHVTHTISAPSRVWLKQNEQGEDDVVEVESFTGTVLVRLPSASESELVDGMLAEKATA